MKAPSSPAKETAVSWNRRSSGWCSCCHVSNINRLTSKDWAAVLVQDDNRFCSCSWCSCYTYWYTVQLLVHLYMMPWYSWNSCWCMVLLMVQFVYKTKNPPLWAMPIKIYTFLICGFLLVQLVQLVVHLLLGRIGRVRTIGVAEQLPCFPRLQNDSANLDTSSPSASCNEKISGSIS